MRRKAVLVGVLASLGLPSGALAHDATRRDRVRQDADPVVGRWNQELLSIVRTPGAQPPTVHPTRTPTASPQDERPPEGCWRCVPATALMSLRRPI